MSTHTGVYSASGTMRIQGQGEHWMRENAIKYVEGLLSIVPPWFTEEMAFARVERMRQEAAKSMSALASAQCQRCEAAEAAAEAWREIATDLAATQVLTCPHCGRASNQPG